MTSVRTSVLFAAAIVAVAPAPAGAVDSIPFTMRDGAVAVQGSVDGAPAVPMLVDLGAGVDVLSSDVGRRYVVVKGKYVSLRLTGERVDLPIGTVNSFTIGGVAIEAPNVGIWSGLDATGVGGLVSATAFRNIATTFDYTGHKIVIEDAETFPDRKRTGLRIPLVLQDDLGISLAVFARFDFGGGKTGLCEIDTGTAGITIDDSLAASLGVDLKDPRYARTPSPTGAQVRAQIASIALAGEPQTAISRPTVTFGNLIYDCNVGNDFWTNRTFTLDLPERALYLATPS